MTLTEKTITERIAFHQVEIDQWRNILRQKACKNCTNWAAPGCGLADNAIPPLDVQKAACPAWEFDYVPF